ncbi:hypothetical protein Drorol1_Dr00027106, partial [Drosera rotundifolia]
MHVCPWMQPILAVQICFTLGPKSAENQTSRAPLSQCPSPCTFSSFLSPPPPPPSAPSSPFPSLSADSFPHRLRLPPIELNRAASPSISRFIDTFCSQNCVARQEELVYVVTYDILFGK